MHNALKKAFGPAALLFTTAISAPAYATGSHHTPPPTPPSNPSASSSSAANADAKAQADAAAAAQAKAQQKQSQNQSQNTKVSNKNLNHNVNKNQNVNQNNVKATGGDARSSSSATGGNATGGQSAATAQNGNQVTGQSAQTGDNMTNISNSTRFFAPANVAPDVNASAPTTVGGVDGCTVLETKSHGSGWSVGGGVGGLIGGAVGSFGVGHSDGESHGRFIAECGAHNAAQTLIVTSGEDQAQRAAGIAAWAEQYPTIKKGLQRVVDNSQKMDDRPTTSALEYLGLKHKDKDKAPVPVANAPLVAVDARSMALTSVPAAGAPLAAQPAKKAFAQSGKGKAANPPAAQPKDCSPDSFVCKDGSKPAPKP